jgi:hypothetical protein
MTRIGKFLAAGVAAASMMVVSTAANATNYNITLVANGDGTFSSLPFGNHVTTPMFTDVASFSIGAPGSADATLTTILLNGVANVNFTSVLLDGVNLFNITHDALGVDNATLTPTILAAGTHTITVNGNLAGSGGTYSGVLNIGAVAVPEPATWAMMIFGMGMVGFGLRLRRRTADAATA